MNAEKKDGVEVSFPCAKSQKSPAKEIGLSFWIKPIGRSGKRVRIFANEGNYNITQEKNRIIFCYSGTTRWHGYETFSVLKPGVWQNVVLSFKFGDTDSMKCWVNGNLKPGHWYAGSGGDLYKRLPGRRFLFGSPSTMDLYDVRVYDRLLSEEDARKFYMEKVAELDGNKKTAGLSNKEEADCLAKLNALKTRLNSINTDNPSKKYWQAVLTNASTVLENNLKANSLEIKPETANEKIIRLEKLFEALSNGKLQSKYFVPYVVAPLSNRRILPDTINIRGEISDTLYIVATPGEYEAASFLLYAPESIKGLKLELSDMKRKGDPSGKSIPASAIDVRIVKCWYQDLGISAESWLCQEEIPNEKYNPIYTSGIQVLVPELLLHDDSLVKVDREREENYLKLQFRDNTEYVLPFSKEKGACYSKKSFPFFDSKDLRPTNISRNTNKQFWLTFKAPDNCDPGVYEGSIALSAECPDDLKSTIKLKIRILPFKLVQPQYISSIYYYPPDRTFYKDGTKKQLEKELQNLYDHGVYNPSIPNWGFSFAEYLALRKKIGMDKEIIFYQKVFGNPVDPEKLKAVKKKVAAAISTAKKYGAKSVYFYGLDEAKGKRLLSQRKVWEAVHEAGGKIYVSGCKANFKLMGDIQDAIVKNGYPDRNVAEEWHSKDHLIFCYANPQGGVEQAETYRRNMGLLIWQNDYDGPMTWLYYSGFPVRNDKRAETTTYYKQHNMVYPSANGVIDTVQWEGYREGVDDVRYLATLEKLISEKINSSVPEARAAAVKARDYLNRLKDADLGMRDLDAVRLEIIQHILNLQK